ncbi:MAG TPA: hypothetical protein VHV08_01795 [Pirellulales bacterium]|nr:hypothetical protein [Pirellulales bacterium]
MWLPSARAQRPAPKAGTTKGAAQPGESDKRAEILNSPRWRRATSDFNQALAALPIYDKKQVERMKADQLAQLAKMSPAQLLAALADIETKNQILATQAAQEVLGWLGRIFAEYTPKGLERRWGFTGVPDFGAMSAQQMSTEILKLQRMQAQTAQETADTSAQTQPQVDPWDPGAKAAQQAYRQDHAATGGGYSSPYRTAPAKKPFADVKTGPDIGFSVGSFGGFRMYYNTGSF